MAVLALVFVVLAFIGLAVSVFAGVIYANRSIQRHIHIVSKKTMTKDLVVKDLAPGGVDVINSEILDPQNDIETGLLLTNRNATSTYDMIRRN